MTHKRVLDDPCIAKALPDEPAFVLLARDPMMPALVRLWVAMRREEIANGTRPMSDLDQVTNAEAEAERAAVWRRDAKESWRRQGELPIDAVGAALGNHVNDAAVYSGFDPNLHVEPRLGDDTREALGMATMEAPVRAAPTGDFVVGQYYCEKHVHPFKAVCVYCARDRQEQVAAAQKLRDRPLNPDRHS
jgi:hypothetical protein